jgi:hypothetical protein
MQISRIRLSDRLHSRLQQTTLSAFSFCASMTWARGHLKEGCALQEAAEALATSAHVATPLRSGGAETVN